MYLVQWDERCAQAFGDSIDEYDEFFDTKEKAVKFAKRLMKNTYDHPRVVIYQDITESAINE